MGLTMILILAGSIQEAELHAAINGYEKDQWTFATAIKVRSKEVAVTRIDCVGGFRDNEEWGEIMIAVETHLAGGRPKHLSRELAELCAFLDNRDRGPAT